MTVEELYRATAALGFENEIEEEQHFYSAANRALLTVNRIRPRQGRVAIGESRAGTCLDMNALCRDFLSFSPLPLRLDGIPCREGIDFLIEDESHLRLCTPVPIRADVVYYRTLRRISAEETDADIDLPADLCELMPLLVASTLWADDDMQKASYYLALYREEALAMQRRHDRAQTLLYRTTNHW